MEEGGREPEEKLMAETTSEICYVTGFEDEGRGPMSQKGDKGTAGKKTDSLLEPSERNTVLTTP